ncbi:MAG: sugar transferase [Myxococcota bacterium]
MHRRWFDLVLVSGGIIVFTPVMVGLSAAIWWEDGGDVFFVQERLGRHRRPFRILKLRSMRDGEVTRVGRWIRATGLDEVAQFRNVLRGEMRLVGPRPLTGDDVVRLGWDHADADHRFAVPPGITGLAQVFGRGARPSLALDEAYIRNQSLRLDAELVAISFVVNALGKARTRRLLQVSAAQRLRAVRLAHTVLRSSS